MPSLELDVGVVGNAATSPSSSDPAATNGHHHHHHHLLKASTSSTSSSQSSSTTSLPSPTILGAAADAAGGEDQVDGTSVMMAGNGFAKVVQLHQHEENQVVREKNSTTFVSKQTTVTTTSSTMMNANGTAGVPSVEEPVLNAIKAEVNETSSKSSASVDDDHSDDPSVAFKKTGKEYVHGPDQIIPTEALWTTICDGATKIRKEDSGPAHKSSISVPTILERTAARCPNHTALAVKRDNQWVKWTYTQYLHNVRTCAKAFIHLGLEPHHAVCILGFNSPEWFISNLAAIYAGGFAAGVYTTNSAEACHHCAANSEANIYVVEDEKQLAKILEIRDRLPNLKAIVQYEGIPKHEGVLSWSQLMFLGTQQSDAILKERLKRISINQGCLLIYTSGTTGLPKGVMLNHDNVTWTAQQVLDCVDASYMKEVFVSYLPLSHIAAQLVDIYVPILIAGTVYFAGKDALKGGLGFTLKEVRPTKFVGVPRVWEKINEKMVEIGKQTKGLKKAIATWAKGKGTEYMRRRLAGNNTPPFGFALANALVFKKVHQALGLDRCTMNITSAAPLAVEVKEFFGSLNINLCEAYGMSESSGPQSVTPSDVVNFVSAGLILQGCHTKLDNTDKDGNGEVCMWGRHVFMGYLGMEDKTKEAMDKEGWLHSGDIGKIDSKGFLYITGRIKELIITAGGENVSPILIEDAIKAELPGVSNVMLIGDRKKFLSLLVTLKTDMDGETGEPLDTLSVVGRDWVRQAGSEATKVSEIIATKDEKVYKAIQDGINRANLKAPSNAQRVQKWSLLPKDFSIPGGELGPTMKLKRGPTTAMYQDIIDGFYAGL